MISEAEIQADIQNWLDAKKIFWKRMPLGSIKHSGVGRRKNPMKGFPDLWGFCPWTTIGEIFVIEVKAKDGRLSPEQVDWQMKFEEFGVFYIEARSLDDVIEAFTRRTG